MKKFFTLVVLSLALLFSSCATHPLESKWSPLKSVVQTGDLPFLGENTTMTISPYLYTEDLDNWLEMNPPGSVHYEALLRHEHKHALEQENYPAGKKAWLFKYVNNKEFRWEAEKAGYHEEILYYLEKGYHIIPEDYATALSEDYQGMVSYEEALAWINSILKGE